MSQEYWDIAGLVTLEINKKVGAGFSLLDIGAGSGFAFEKIVERSGVNRINKYVAIEPYPVAATALIQTLNRYDQVSSLVMIELYYQALASDLEQKFDAVLFCHSLYGVRDPIGALNTAKNLLAKNDVVIAFIDSPLGFTELFSEFDLCLNRDRPSIENFKLNSDRAADGLRSSGCNFSLLSISSYFDMSSFFDGGAESTAKRLEFLSFLLQCELADAPRQLVRGVELRLRSGCVVRVGKQVLPQRTDVIVIR